MTVMNSVIRRTKQAQKANKSTELSDRRAITKLKSIIGFSTPQKKAKQRTKKMRKNICIKKILPETEKNYMPFHGLNVQA